VNLLNKAILRDFKLRHPDTQSQIDSWAAEASGAKWKTPLDIKQRYGSASFLKDNHVVFNIKGNKYRLRVQVNYEHQIVLILKAGTHEEYMTW
jgi:mRNA interferase HigB